MDIDIVNGCIYMYVSLQKNSADTHVEYLNTAVLLHPQIRKNNPPTKIYKSMVAQENANKKAGLQ